MYWFPIVFSLEKLGERQDPRDLGNRSDRNFICTEDTSNCTKKLNRLFYIEGGQIASHNDAPFPEEIFRKWREIDTRIDQFLTELEMLHFVHSSGNRWD